MWTQKNGQGREDLPELVMRYMEKRGVNHHSILYGECQQIDMIQHRIYEGKCQEIRLKRKNCSDHKESYELS